MLPGFCSDCHHAPPLQSAEVGTKGASHTSKMLHLCDLRSGLHN